MRRDPSASGVSAGRLIDVRTTGVGRGWVVGLAGAAPQREAAIVISTAASAPAATPAPATVHTPDRRRGGASGAGIVGAGADPDKVSSAKTISRALWKRSPGS